jgi:Lrp/AsnC family transcriptional regulator, regulator for asnA, asnC and gidA
MAIGNLNESSRPESLDKIDQFIIDALRQDGRVAFTQIAHQLQVSPGMIRVRYNRLVDLGILKVVAVTNPLRMGMTTMAMIGLRVDGTKLLEIAKQIAALDEVLYLVFTSGAYDIMTEVVCRDHAHLLQFLAGGLYQIEGVRESESFMYLKIVKEVYY